MSNFQHKRVRHGAQKEVHTHMKVEDILYTYNDVKLWEYVQYNVVQLHHEEMG